MNSYDVWLLSAIGAYTFGHWIAGTVILVGLLIGAAMEHDGG